jgi:thermitase
LCCRSRAQSSRKEESDEDSIVRPKVIRRTTSSKPSEDDLPLGAILTGAAKLREEGLTGEGVRVAVIDSGIDEKHPGFSGQVTRKMWYRSGTPLSKDDHGTHVAGTIHLMALNAQIYDYRVFGRSGNFSVTQAVAKSIMDATDSDCQVINMSLGGPFPSPEIKQAVQYAASKGVVLVCAAGNEGGK